LVKQIKRFKLECVVILLGEELEVLLSYAPVYAVITLESRLQVDLLYILVKKQTLDELVVVYYNFSYPVVINGSDVVKQSPHVISHFKRVNNKSGHLTRSQNDIASDSLERSELVVERFDDDFVDLRTVIQSLDHCLQLVQVGDETNSLVL
jgi:hypothetical protein